MKLADALALIQTYEKLAQKTAAAIDARAALTASLGAAEVGKLADAFPDAEAFAAFAAAMPATPKLEDVVKAFQPDTKDLADLISVTLKGDAKLLSVLAEKGCDRDPAVLKKLADEFKSDPKPLQEMIEEGGLGDHPEAMAAMLQAGCEKDPAKLRALCAKFGVKLDRERLAGILGSGGLGQAPETVGALAKEGGGDMLRQMSVAFDDEPKRTKLRELLSDGGCDAAASGRPGLLADVVRDGLGGNPARLIELHDAFKGGGADELPNLGKMLAGLDGDDGKAGKRLGTLHAALKSRAGAATDAQVSVQLRDPYMKSISDFSMAGKMPPVIARGAAKDAAAAAAARPMPPAAQRAATLAGGLKNRNSADLLEASLTDPGRSHAASAAGMTDGLGKRADALKLTPAAGDPGQTDETKLTTAAANDAAAALAKRTDGGTPADIEALAKLGVAALEAAALEPDDATRDAALAAAKLVETTVTEALRRLAAKTLAGAPGADAATVAQAALDGLPVTTPAGVKKAAEAIAAAGMQACAASQGATQDPHTASAAAKKAIEEGYDLPARAGAEKTAREAAEKAAATAEAAAKLVTNAPRPVDAALLQRAATAAANAVALGGKSADEAAAKKAFDAAKALATAIADAVREAAGRFALAAAQDTAGGKAGLAAATDTDKAVAILERLVPPSPAIPEVKQAAKAARGSALTGADAGAMETADKGDLKKAAQETAYRSAAATAGGEPDTVAIGNAEAAADIAADMAAKDADLATSALTSAAVATDPAAYVTLIEDAARLAEAALTSARAAPDDTKRDAAVLAAKNGAAAAADGAKKLAAYHQAAAQTQLNTRQATEMTAAAGPRDALPQAMTTGVGVPGAKANAQAAFDNGKIAIADAAAAELARLAETEATVRTANEAADGKQILASLPGADENAKLDALIAARDAAEQLSIKATAGFHGLVVGLPAVPPAGDPMPPDPDAPFAPAMTALKAATGAANAWVAAAKAVETAAKGFEAALGKIAVPTPEEAATLLAMTNAKAPAKVATGLAETALAGIDTDAETLRDSVTAWTEWANTNHRVPVVDPGTTKLQDITGFAISLQLEAKVPAKTEAELIQSGPSLKKVAYAGPATAAGVANGAPADIDMAHITDRHVPSTYKFVPESSPRGSEHDAGLLLTGKLAGVPQNQRTSKEKALIKQGKSNKKNSFFPETVDAAAALTMAQDALNAAAALQTPPGLPIWLFNQVALQPIGGPKQQWQKVWFEPSVNVNLPGANPPQVVPCTVGVAIATNPGGGPTAKPKVRMFYPDPGNKLSMPDVLVMAKAVGVAQ